LLAARRSGSMALGTEAVLRALESGARDALVLFAADAAGKREEIARRADERGARSIVFGTKLELGRLTGRDELGVLAILDAGIAEEVAATAARATQLSEAE
jgi:ribosomal protein L7Ae-like RNA K-turn-binding protein